MFNYFKNKATKAKISDNLDRIDHYNTLLTRCMSLENQVNNMTDKDIHCPLFIHQSEADSYLHSRLITFGRKVRSSSINPNFAYSFMAYSQEEKLNLIRDHYQDQLYSIKDYLLSRVDELTNENINLAKTMESQSLSLLEVRNIINNNLNVTS